MSNSAHDKTPPTLAEALIAYRKRHNISQIELARRSKVAQGDISRIERGLRGVGLTTAARLYRVCSPEIAIETFFASVDSVDSES